MPTKWADESHPHEGHFPWPLSPVPQDGHWSRSLIERNFVLGSQLDMIPPLGLT
jgi:hypothetical protein